MDISGHNGTTISKEGADPAAEPLLTLSEVARYLKVAGKTIMRMLRRNEIPAVKVAGQWRFVRAALDEWLMSGMRGVRPDALVALREPAQAPYPLSRLVKEDCILTGLRVRSRNDLFARLAAPLAQSGVVADAPALRRRMLARERMVSTAIGNGVALPHAREPAAVAGRYGLTIGIVPGGIAFAAPDRQPVTTFVLVCADSVPRHLALMAQVALALRDGAVRRAWREARQPGDVLTALIRHEQRKLLE